MWLSALRIQADWFSGTLKDWQNADQGINALLAQPAQVPRDGTDPQPATVTVIEETRDTAAALERLPETGNVVALRLDREMDLQAAVRTTMRDFEVPIIAAIGCVETDTWKAVRDGAYIARAAVRSLRELGRNENAMANKRRRNNMALIELMSLRLVPAEGQIGDRQVTAALRFTWKVRDELPG